MTRVTTAYVLAAGLGTRLAPFTDERPKPLIEVCGTPLLAHTLSLLERAGIERVGINTHWLGAQIRAAFGSRFGALELHYTEEPAVLGTGGGLLALSKVVPPPKGERVLVMNADALIDLNLAALLACPDDALATLVLQHTPDVHRYGAIGTDADSRIVTFAGRIPPLGDVVDERMFCGVHLVHPRAFSVLPAVSVSRDASGTNIATGTMSGINDEGYPVWLKEGTLLRGFDLAGTFCDVGTPERLFLANLALLSGAWSSDFLRPFRRFTEVRPQVYVAKTAQVAAGATLQAPVLIDDGAVIEDGATVELAVVGRGCRVAAGAQVARAVLLSGAQVAGSLADVVVSPAAQKEIANGREILERAALEPAGRLTAT